MSIRPSTARSEISSAISDDGDSRPQSAINPLSSSEPPSQLGYTHLRGTYHQNRAVRSPPPGAPSSTTGSSRAHTPTSQSTRTHIPSLTAQAFFRPLSSQRLQAQRSRRPNTGSTAPPPIEDEAEEPDEDARSSVRQGPYAATPAHYRPAPSIGTDYSEPETRGTSFEARLHNNATPRPPANGHTPPAQASQPQKPAQLNLVPESTQSRPYEPPQKSPLSFRSGFSLSSKRQPGHQHLSSTDTTPQYDIVIPQPSSHAANLGKNYEYFEGNTLFWMGGRLQNSRDKPINVATGIFLILPAVLFFVYSGPYLWHHVSPALPITFAYLFFVCASSFVHASLVDPGIFPRNIHPFPPEVSNEDPLAIGPPMNDWVMVRLATSETAAMDVPVKYCKTCNIWRPPRCYHCRVCDNCVETLDHHCVWLNNCVGRRNYRYFFAFASTSTLLAIYLTFASLGHCLKYRSQHHITFAKAINANRVPFAMFIYGILAGGYPLSLWIYHLLLTGKGETTREFLNSRRFPKKDRHLPFTQGNFIKNWIAVFGRPKPPTYLHFKRQYEEGDQRFGPRKGRHQAPLVAEAQNGGMEMTRVQRSFEGPHTHTMPR